MVLWWVFWDVIFLPLSLETVGLPEQETHCQGYSNPAENKYKILIFHQNSDEVLQFLSFCGCRSSLKLWNVYSKPSKNRDWHTRGIQSNVYLLWGVLYIWARASKGASWVTWWSCGLGRNVGESFQDSFDKPRSQFWVGINSFLPTIFLSSKIYLGFYKEMSWQFLVPMAHGWPPKVTSPWTGRLSIRWTCWD